MGQGRFFTGGGTGLLGGFRRGVAPIDIIGDVDIDIDSTDRGVLYVWNPLITPTPRAFSKAGGSANLSIHATSGAVSAAATTTGGAVQFIDVQAASSDGLVIVAARITFTNIDAVVVTFPFDALTAAPAIATSWARRLFTSYAGPAGRVRRSSDNAEADIPFSAGVLDEAALTSHCGSGHGYIVTLYDQSGNGRHPTQSTPTEQPIVVNAGAIQRLNGKPAFKSIDSASSGLLTTPPMATTTEMTVNVVARTDLNAVNKLFMLADFPVQVLAYVPYTDGIVYIDIGAGTAPNRISGASGITVGNAFIATLTNSVTNSRKRVWISTSLKASDSTGQAATVSYFKLWNPFDGATAEALVFAAELSGADRNLVEQNQMTFYGIS